MMPSDVRLAADASTKEAFMEAWKRAGEPAESYPEFSRCHYPSDIDTRDLFLAAFRSGQEDKVGEDELADAHDDGYDIGVREGRAEVADQMCDLLIDELGVAGAQPLVAGLYPQAWRQAVIRDATRNGDGS